MNYQLKRRPKAVRVLMFPVNWWKSWRLCDDPVLAFWIAVSIAK